MSLLCVATVVHAREPQYLPYTITISKTGQKAIDEGVAALSSLVGREAKPPATRIGLQRRIAADRKAITGLLRSEGYYQAEVNETVDLEASPASIELRILTGERFTIGAYAVRLAAAVPGDPLESFPLPKPGAPARAPDVVEAEGAVLARLAQTGRPFAKVTDRDIVVDHATRKMTIALTIDPGPAAVFGKLDMEGLDQVDADYLRRQLPWQAGEPYDQRKIDAGRRALVRSGLFSSVVLQVADQAKDGGEVPISVEVAERERRSIGIGLRYQSDVGAGTEIFWRHRNLFGGAETVDLSADVAQSLLSATAQYRSPRFFETENALLLGIGAKQERLDAYDSRSATATASLERVLSKKTKGSAGIGLEAIETDKNGIEAQFVLLSLPLQLRRDSSNDLLDPSRGSRLTFGYTPVFPLAGDSGLFHRFQVSAATYYQVLADKRLILALRGAFGSLLGATLSDVPATWRLYAGGGGSIRGYDYQRAGPLDANRDAAGGRSVVEASVEARIRLTENIGIVPFLDAGNAYRSVLPDLAERIQYAAGLGVRYYTSFGPIRADIALPINRRPGIDDKFQFYISLGQAF